MKIWIDLTNSPHINFFKPFIKQWNDQGIEIVITARDLANTIPLINQNSWEYTEVGGHAGKSKIRKILYFPKRVLQLRKFLKKQKPDIGISHSSFYSPLVCKFLGIPSIYLNDNEHAKGNLVAFKFATLNLLPEFLKDPFEKKGWSKKYPMDFYPGIKEGIYLSQGSFAMKGDQEILEKRDTVYIRLEPWTAEYYSGDSKFMDPLIMELSETNRVVILPRSKEQIEHFKQAHFNRLTVSEQPIGLETIYDQCLLFIGAGGSMTRELAFLGVPTLSVYQGDLLEVDNYLVKKKYMDYNPKPDIKDIKKALRNQSSKKNNDLNEKGIEAFELINDSVKRLINNRN